MRLIEVMCSMMIFLLTVACTAMSFTTVIKSKGKTEEILKESNKVLEIDRGLRQKIWSTDIPYWKCMEREIDKKITGRFFEVMEENFHLEEIKVNRNEKGIMESLSIGWRYKGKYYKTVEKFCVRQVVNCGRY